MRRLVRPLLFVTALIVCGPSWGAAWKDVEVKPFGILDVRGAFVARYLFDKQERGIGEEAGFESRDTWEQELNVLTRSYVYHPGFLNISLNAGPKLVQQQFDSSIGGNDNDEVFFNYRLRLNFLDYKSYPFSLYVGRSHPSVSTGLSGRFLTRKNEHGFSWNLTEFKNLSISALFDHFDTVGSGFDSVIDDSTDRASLRFLKTYGDGNNIRAEQTQTIRDSESGSPGLPIQRSRIRTDNTMLQANNYFGTSRQHSLTQRFNHLDQEINERLSTALRTSRYNAAARFELRDGMLGFVDYNVSETGRGPIKSNNEGIAARMSHVLGERLNYSLRADYVAVEQTGFERDRIGFDGSASYWMPTSFGTLSVGGTIRKENNDQVSTADSVQVFDEPVTLSGAEPVTLLNEFVIDSTVVVFNESRTQVFVEGLDYRLLTVGSLTRIQRLIGSNIADGETVLVDYEYRTSGTAEFDTFSTSLNLSATFLQYWRAQLSFIDRDSDVLSGELTTPLNDQAAIRFALGADFPVGDNWTVGVEYRFADQNETISPYVRNSFNARASAGVIGSMKLNLSAGLLEIDQERSTEDVDQVYLRAGLSGQPWPRVRVDLNSSFLRDTGGSLPRQQIQHRLNLQWHYRRVRVLFRATLGEDTLGPTERRYTRFTAEVNRAF